MSSIHENKSPHVPISSSTKMRANNFSKSEANFEGLMAEKKV